MRIFINNFDSYVGKAVCEDLRSLADEDGLHGTLSTEGAAVGEAPEEDETAALAESLGVKHVVTRVDQKDYLQTVTSCNLIVYDLHSGDPDDIEFILKHMKVAKLERDTVFVLISSVNVWAKTLKERVPLETDEDEEEDEEEDDEAEDEKAPVEKKMRPEELTDKDLDRRSPSADYETWKYIEALTLALGFKAKLRPHVVAAGILYGNGETVFNELFKAAWLTQPVHKIIHPGDNYIPCVHVRDVARLVGVIASDKTVVSYLIAVDKARLTQADIIQGIVDQISNKKKVPVLSAEEVDYVFKEVLMLDLIMQPSAPMQDENFKWWCEHGLVKNLDRVAEEFCRCRNLRPIKLVVTGPPGSGAERYCSMVAERYLHADPPHFTFDSILHDALGDGSAAAKRLQRKVDKLGKTLGAKLPLKIRTKLVRTRLQSNVCRYRGYVLESYPASYEEAEALFTELAPPEGEEPLEEGEAAEEEEEEEEDEEDEEEEEEPPQQPTDEDEEEDDTKPKRILCKAIIPEFAASIQSIAERCKVRLFKGARGANGEADFLLKTAEYRKNNLAEDGSPATSDFFVEVAGLKVLQIDADTTTDEQAFETMKSYLESKGQFFNYLRSEEEIMAEKQAEVAKREREEEERKAKATEDLIATEHRLREKQGQEDDSRRRMIREQEANLLESEALPLRSYLMSHVVPTLSDGLSLVCKEQPEDPIEFLAQYLFSHAQDIDGLEEGA